MIGPEFGQSPTTELRQIFANEKWLLDRCTSKKK